jgi:hypothetical protein
MSLLGILQGYVAHRLLLDEIEIGDDVVEHILDLLLNGLYPAPLPTPAANAGEPVRSPAHPQPRTQSNTQNL